jgi:hypothetical protein
MPGTLDRTELLALLKRHMVPPLPQLRGGDVSALGAAMGAIYQGLPPPRARAVAVVALVGRAGAALERAKAVLRGIKQSLNSLAAEPSTTDPVLYELAQASNLSLNPYLSLKQPQFKYRPQSQS